jgi:hypothetical protein
LSRTFDPIFLATSFVFAALGLFSLIVLVRDVRKLRIARRLTNPTST